MLFLVLLACVHPDPFDPPEPSPAEARVPSHGREAVQLRDDVIHGDLDGARQDVPAVARAFPLAGVPASLAPKQRAVVAAANRAAAATDVASAASAVGDLAVACGSCHTAAGVTPAMTAPPAPDSVDGVRAEMGHHDRAMSRMWAGLVIPSADERRGAVADFRATSLTPLTPDPAAPHVDEAVNTAAQAVADATSDAARAEAFGRLVATCAGCHLARPGGIGIEPE